jgi:hypothetical protein
MVEQIDKEVEAIKVVLTALEPLTPQLRSSVVEYVMKRLGVSVEGQGQPGAPLQPPLQPDLRIRGSGSADLGATPIHIKVFKETKKPRSANEMAALVAYYLSDLAPPGARKHTINTKDIETYFKIAEFPRPEHVKVTLQNAKTAGYFDAIGEGEYKLNAVGHNLVVHSMPRGATAGTATKKKRSKKNRSTVKKKR